MSPLNIHAEENASAPKKSKNKMLKIMLGIGALIMIPVIGTTLAAQVTINTGGPDNEVLFAQGKAATVACDPDVLVKAKSEYSYGAYRLKEVTVSGIDDAACGGKVFVLSVADTNVDTYQRSEIGFYNYSTPTSVEANLSGTTGCTDVTCAYSSGTLTITIPAGGTTSGTTYWQYDGRTLSTDVGDVLLQQANAG
jgi:hypothetical protein